MRVVIPLFLADYTASAPALLDLFPEADLPLRNLRGVTCNAFANGHHDAAKMQDYEERIGRANQRFFTDPDEARAWLARA